MDKLTSRKDLRLRGEGPANSAIRDLSEHEVASVAGAGCTWWEMGHGNIYHSSYEDPK